MRGRDLWSGQERLGAVSLLGSLTDLLEQQRSGVPLRRRLKEQGTAFHNARRKLRAAWQRKTGSVSGRPWRLPTRKAHGELLSIGSSTGPHWLSGLAVSGRPTIPTKCWRRSGVPIRFLQPACGCRPLFSICAMPAASSPGTSGYGKAMRRSMIPWLARLNGRTLSTLQRRGCLPLRSLPCSSSGDPLLAGGARGKFGRSFRDVAQRGARIPWLLQ